MSDDKANQPATELRCSECGEWSPESKWRETEAYCEDCGSHSAMACPLCDEVYDTVGSQWYDLKVRPTGSAAP